MYDSFFFFFPESSSNINFRSVTLQILEKKNHLRYASAVEIYKKGKATLTKGAEIAGVSPDNFRGILNDQGVVTPDTVEWESIE